MLGGFPGGEITLLTRHLPTCLLDGGLLLHSPGVTGRLATISLTSSPLSPAVLSTLITSRDSLVAVPPAGMELLASQVAADREVVPSEEYAAPM